MSHHDLDALLPCSDGRALPGQSGTQHQDIRFGNRAYRQPRISRIHTPPKNRRGFRSPDCPAVSKVALDGNFAEALA